MAITPLAAATSTIEAKPVSPPAPAPAAGKPALRARLFKIIGAAVATLLVIWLLYYWLIGSNYISTEDAYVGANVSVVTPQIAGAITEVAVNDAQEVRKGDVLVRIDPADAQLAVAQAEAEYGRADRRVRSYFANDQSNVATIASRHADVARARAQLASADSDLARARIDLRRRQSLAKTGVVSGEELTTSINGVETAQASREAAVAALAQARANQGVASGQHKAGRALTEGVDRERNPEVAAARAALDIAKLALSRTVIRAPVDGLVARRRAQVGQRVAVGAELLSVVPLRDVYVDANFKEVQLKRVEPGQPVELTADRYGGSVVYHGRVIGIGGGTGAAFSTIPAQNATGNWIKVVQRLPVRIALDPKEVARHPLRVGLSMDTTIDLRPRTSRSEAAR